MSVETFRTSLNPLADFRPSGQNSFLAKPYAVCLNPLADFRPSGLLLIIALFF